MRNLTRIFFAFIFFHSLHAFSQSTDTLVLRDIEWDKTSPAGMTELFISSSGSQLQGFIYKANGAFKHPTLLLLHGYPGNERNLDLAQVVRAHGWNVIYFNYRGSWGSQGTFSFTNAVVDVKNVVAFCKRNADSLLIDTANIVLFGHSMGGWVCLKALQQLPTVKKGFALSTWDIAGDFKNATTRQQMLAIATNKDIVGPHYFVLNSSVEKIFQPVIAQRAFYDLRNDGKALAGKQIIMLDEHNGNKQIAEAIQKNNNAFFQYEVWQTDHPFTNKRVALMKKVLSFLDK
jgi:pimeloyl-ACP methyl ester carboxylesterase